MKFWILATAIATFTSATGAAVVAAGTVAAASSTTTVTLHAGFSPDRLGAATNVSATVKFSANTAPVAPPISNLTLYAPAGTGVDLRGTGTCTAAKLEANGPSGCPPDSRAGFGSGVSAGEIAGEVFRESFTLDFFFAANENGHLAILVYVNGSTPDAVQLVLVAKQIAAPKPYGLGFSVEVPPVATLPGAPDAAVERISFSFGATGVAYYTRVHGHRKLLHVKGITVPKTCPHGGFPVAGRLAFADGSTSAAETTIPCPHA